jgi:hypothetical protein
MNTLIATITWGINCPLERSCVISLDPMQPVKFLGVFNFPVQRGRWRHGIDGLAGAMGNGRSTYKKSSITADFSFSHGLRSRILPVRRFRWRSRACRRIGRAATAIARFSWKHWLTGNDSKARAIRRPTGYTWEKRAAAGGWTGTMPYRERRSRRFMCTPFHPDFVKNWRDVRKGALWDLRLAFLNRIQQRASEI